MNALKSSFFAQKKKKLPANPTLLTIYSVFPNTDTPLLPGILEVGVVVRAKQQIERVKLKQSFLGTRGLPK